VIAHIWSKASYRLCIRLGKLKRRPKSNKRAVKPNKEGEVLLPSSRLESMASIEKVVQWHVERVPIEPTGAGRRASVCPLFFFVPIG
jgi:hypothetical protein